MAARTARAIEICCHGEKFCIGVPNCEPVPGERFELPTNGLQNRVVQLILQEISPVCRGYVASKVSQPCQRLDGRLADCSFLTSTAYPHAFHSHASNAFSAAASSAPSSTRGNRWP